MGENGGREMIEAFSKIKEIVSKVSNIKNFFNIDKKIEKQENLESSDFEDDKYNPDEKIPKVEDSFEQESIEQLKSDYLDDVIKNSECPETIDKEKAMLEVYERSTSSETRQKRIEFAQMKKDLRNEWEKLHGRPWPRYDRDIKDENGNIIRRKGDRYDAHHIQPLTLGGKNEASNITPLSAAVHYDHRGVHSLNSPFSKLNKKIGA